jgi:hypothetical protein
MSISYRYFALVTRVHPSVEEPSTVCRQWTDDDGRVHSQVYTQDLRWQDGGIEGEAHPITEEAARRFEELQATRVRGYEPADGRYSYSVIVTGLRPIENPHALLRTWLSPQGYSVEQVWTPTGGWMNSSYTDDLRTGHLDGEAVGIAEEDVERYKAIAEQNHRDATRVIEYRYFAIVADGHTVDDPLTVVRQWDEGDEVKEEQFVIDLTWEPSDLLAQHGSQAVPVDSDAATRFEYTQVKRYRKKYGR